MADSMSYYKSGFMIGIEDDFVVLSPELLKKGAYFEYVEKGRDIYRVGMNDFYAHTRYRVMGLVYKGYSVVFECQGKRVLIIYNRNLNRIFTLNNKA